MPVWKNLEMFARKIKKTIVQWEDADLPLSVEETKMRVHELIGESEDAVYDILEVPEKTVNPFSLQLRLHDLVRNNREARRNIVVTVTERPYGRADDRAPHFTALMLDRRARTALWADSTDEAIPDEVRRAVGNVYQRRGKPIMCWQRYTLQQYHGLTCGIWMLDNVRRWLDGRPLFVPKTPWETDRYIERVQDEFCALC